MIIVGHCFHFDHIEKTINHATFAYMVQNTIYGRTATAADA
jgi:hypothetical protein